MPQFTMSSRLPYFCLTPNCCWLPAVAVTAAGMSVVAGTDDGIPAVVGIPAAAGFPAVAGTDDGIPAVAGIPAAAAIPAVAGTNDDIPAVAGTVGYPSCCWQSCCFWHFCCC